MDLVENAAKNVFFNLLKRQKSEQDPDTESKKEHLRNELKKVNKTLIKFDPR